NSLRDSRGDSLPPWIGIGWQVVGVSTLPPRVLKLYLASWSVATHYMWGVNCRLSYFVWLPESLRGRPGVPPSGSRAAPRASCRITAIRLCPQTPSALAGLRAPLAKGRLRRVLKGGLAVSLHRITAFSPSRAARAMRVCGLAAVVDP